MLEAGYSVRVMVRDAARLQGREWISRVQIVEGDVTRPETLPRALRGVAIAYYLVHSMGAGAGFEDADLLAARSFGRVAREEGVGHLVYLGGLGDPGQRLSPHLRSRQLTGEALREAGVPLTEFRAAVIVGSGSVSFEMIRHLTERVPRTGVSPLGQHQDPTHRHRRRARLPGGAPEKAFDGVVEVGGADVLTYGDMMLGYAHVRGLHRVLLPVPVLSPRLSSYWVHWVTPVPASIARPLIEGLRNEVIVRDDTAGRLFEDIHPAGYRQALEKALETLRTGEVETSWCDAVTTSSGVGAPVCLISDQGMIVERRQRQADAPAAAVYRVFTGLGGERGWPSLAFTWRLRGAADRLVGGVGVRRRTA